MDKKEREAIRQRRDEAIAFVSAEMTGKKKRYAAFVKEMESTSLEGGASGMEKLGALMSRCLPQDCKTMLETAFRVFFGDGIGKELEETFDAKNYDDLARECVVNRRTIAVSYDGNISVTDKKEEPFDGLYLDMEEYEKLKNSIPPMMRQSFIDTLSFMFETEAELKEYMTAMNNCIMFLYVVLGVNVPTMFENLRTIVREEKDETAIFAYYYIFKDRGLQKVAKLLPSILLTGEAGYPGLGIFSGIIGHFVSASTAMGIHDKSSWREVMDETDSDDLWKEVANALRYAEDNHGQKKELVSLEDMLKDDTHGEIILAIGQFTKEYDESIAMAYLLIALERTSCMKRHYPFSTFVEAVNKRFGKEYTYQKAQRRYSEISSMPGMLKENKSSMKKAKKIIEEWKEVFLNCNAGDS